MNDHDFKVVDSDSEENSKKTRNGSKSGSRKVDRCKKHQNRNKVVYHNKGLENVENGNDYKINNPPGEFEISVWQPE